MKLIPLTKGQFAMVSDHRYKHLMQWKWHARWNPRSKTFYAARNQNLAPAGEKWINSMVSMHRYILGLKKDERNDAGEKLQGLHADGNGLNNQDGNLSRGTNSQNAMNRKFMMANNTSGRKGVFFRKDKAKNPWCVFIKVKGKQKQIGCRATFEEAVALRIKGEEKYYGGLARKK